MGEYRGFRPAETDGLPVFVRNAAIHALGIGDRNKRPIIFDAKGLRHRQTVFKILYRINRILCQLSEWHLFTACLC